MFCIRIYGPLTLKKDFVNWALANIDQLPRFEMITDRTQNSFAGGQFPCSSLKIRAFCERLNMCRLICTREPLQSRYKMVITTNRT